MLETPRHYIVLITAMIFVLMQHKEKPWLARFAIAGSSGGMGYAVAPEIAASVSFLGEVTAMGLITALIYGALDMAMSLIADREAIKAIVQKRLGGK